MIRYVAPSLVVLALIGGVAMAQGMTRETDTIVTKSRLAPLPAPDIAPPSRALSHDVTRRSDGEDGTRTWSKTTTYGRAARSESRTTRDHAEHHPEMGQSPHSRTTTMTNSRSDAR